IQSIPANFSIYSASKKRPKERSFAHNQILSYTHTKKKMAEEGQVISCTTVEIWKEKFESASQSKKLAVVDFTASWCGPCRFIAPVLADLAKKMPNVLFLKVDTVAAEFEVEAMPTFIFFKEGKIVHKVIGARKEELVAGVEKHAAIEVASA
ncbi:Thioredoxin H1, partial [Linum perenne]